MRLSEKLAAAFDAGDDRIREDAHEARALEERLERSEAGFAPDRFLAATARAEAAEAEVKTSLEIQDVMREDIVNLSAEVDQLRRHVQEWEECARGKDHEMQDAECDVEALRGKLERVRKVCAATVKQLPFPQGVQSVASICLAILDENDDNP